MENEEKKKKKRKRRSRNFASQEHLSLMANLFSSVGFTWVWFSSVPFCPVLSCCGFHFVQLCPTRFRFALFGLNERR